MKKRPVLTLVAVSFLAAACFPEEDSCHIKTSGIYVEYEVVNDGAQIDAKATFWTGDRPGGTCLVLGDCGDGIKVNGKELSKVDNANPVYYHAAVSKAETYKFSFSREGEGPYDSTVSTPPEVTVTAPEPGEVIPRGTEFDIEWEDNGDAGDVDIEMEGDCFMFTGDEVADSGKYTVPSRDNDGMDDDATCDVSLSVTREKNGSLDAALKGEIVGKSTDKVSFRSTPQVE